MVALWTTHAQLSWFYRDSTPRGRRETGPPQRSEGLGSRLCILVALVPCGIPKMKNEIDDLYSTIWVLRCQNFICRHLMFCKDMSFLIAKKIPGGHYHWITGLAFKGKFISSNSRRPRIVAPSCQTLNVIVAALE